MECCESNMEAKGLLISCHCSLPSNLYFNAMQRNQKLSIKIYIEIHHKNFTIYETVSKHFTNPELVSFHKNSTSEVMNRTRVGCSYGLFFVNTENKTPFKGCNRQAHHPMMIVSRYVETQISRSIYPLSKALQFLK